MTQIAASFFDERKASEVAFYFLSKAKATDASVTKLRLIKWMYLAERLSYARFGEPLTGDRLHSMKHGPVLGEILTMIERPESATCQGAHWNRVVTSSKSKKETHCYMELAKGCPYKSPDDLMELSDAEVDLLGEVWNVYGKVSATALERMLHDPAKYPEWAWSEGQSRNPIELETLFAALHFSEEERAESVAWLERRDEVNRVFAH